VTLPPAGFHRSSNASIRPRVRRIVLGVLAVAFVALVGVPWVASFATDSLRYNEIHFALSAKRPSGCRLRCR
jgi:hypothetical protein